MKILAAFVVCMFWHKENPEFLIRPFLLSLRFQGGTYAVWYKINCVVSSLSMFLQLFYSLFSEFLIFFFQFKT